MPIHVALNHVTHYRYDRAIDVGPQVVRLRPAPHSRTRVLSYALKVLPQAHFINWQQDPQGNYLARLVFPEKATQLRIEVDLIAEIAVFNPFDFFLEPHAQQIPFAYTEEEQHELAPYLETLALTPRFQTYLDGIDRTPIPSIEFLVRLNQQLSQDIRYLLRMEPGVQTPEHTLVTGAGSCRDSAWLLVQLMRRLGVAARFVSGYLIQLVADEQALDGPSGTDVDFTDLHAWCEVYLPGAGWIGLDATSGLFAGEGHIPLACSPEPSSAAPISGRVEPCEVTFSHHMSVQRIWQTPRVTWPVSEQQWADMQALGRRVDAELHALDVRLSIGSEPSFVAIDTADAVPREAGIELPSSRFSATSTSGVFKADMPPSTSWAQSVEEVGDLYEQARLNRLGTQRFMIDGRQSGTGAGNPLLLSGTTAQDSPFLRRPDLLRSLIGYWHDHPALTYLFSGTAWPTPQVDETRSDAVYELEIALAQVPAPGMSCPPGLIDRLLRHLLVDVTGDPARAQFCIAQLEGDGPGERQGVLRLQGLEMPPHARMNLALQLLLRSLVARFWRTPYAPARLTRWGSQLHDRFMLPYFIERDFAEVVGDLNAAGYAMDSQWFAAQLAFRFPMMGDYAVESIELELRHALEPGPGRGSASGTPQSPDASLARLQVRVSGLLADRYRIAVNGRPLPLTATGRAGEFVAGVRYRAWQPDPGAHLTDQVDMPLTFDIVDTWTQRSLGGCQYHAVHPGGRNYESLPVNANEAESRRLARFFRIGHSPGQTVLPPLKVDDDWPMTLDMRRVPPGGV